MANPIGRPLWAEIFDLLRADIASQRLAPGERLPEVDLAERFGVSRGPVRSALVELKRVGLVEISPRRGAQVATLTTDDVEELYDLRTALERLAVEGAHRRASRSAIAALARPIARHQQALDLDDRSGAVNADLDFHHDLCRLSHNGRLLRAWESHADQFRLVIGAVQNDEVWQSQPRVQEHYAILDALLAEDLKAADEALSTHLRNARDIMIAVASRSSSAKRGTPNTAERRRYSRPRAANALHT